MEWGGDALSPREICPLAASLMRTERGMYRGEVISEALSFLLLLSNSHILESNRVEMEGIGGR